MHTFIVKDTAFRGTVGYIHTVRMTIVDMIAKGILSASSANTCELVTSFGHTFVADIYEITLER